jgi:MoaD family protein
MRIKVKFLATLKELFGGEEKEIEVAAGGSNILGLLNLLCDSPQRRQKIFGHSDRPRTYIQIFKNRVPVQSLDGVHTKLEDGDVIAIVPPVFGG